MITPRGLTRTTGRSASQRAPVAAHPSRAERRRSRVYCAFRRGRGGDGGCPPRQGGKRGSKERGQEKRSDHLHSRVGASGVRDLREYFAPRLEELGLARLLDEIEIPLIGVLADMEWRGIAIDAGGLAELSRQFGTELQALEREIHHEAGTDFNINSTPQLRHILFEKLQLPVLKKTKTGPSTDADVLGQLAETGFAVPRLLLEYRELSKLKSTYVDVLPQSVDPATGRIHTRFNQTVTSTGRLSSSDPNLQNIPARSEQGKQIRHV